MRSHAQSHFLFPLFCWKIITIKPHSCLQFASEKVGCAPLTVICLFEFQIYIFQGMVGLAPPFSLRACFVLLAVNLDFAFLPSVRTIFNHSVILWLHVCLMLMLTFVRNAIYRACSYLWFIRVMRRWNRRSDPWSVFERKIVWAEAQIWAEGGNLRLWGPERFFSVVRNTVCKCAFSATALNSKFSILNLNENSINLPPLRVFSFKNAHSQKQKYKFSKFFISFYCIELRQSCIENWAFFQFKSTHSSNYRGGCFLTVPTFRIPPAPLFSVLCTLRGCILWGPTLKGFLGKGVLNLNH